MQGPPGPCRGVGRSPAACGGVVAPNLPPMIPDPAVRPVIIASDIYRHSPYGPNHPLAIPRVSTCTDLIRAMGWLDPAVAIEAPIATAAEIARFHDLGYL